MPHSVGWQFIGHIVRTVVDALVTTILSVRCLRRGGSVVLLGVREVYSPPLAWRSRGGFDRRPRTRESDHTSVFFDKSSTGAADESFLDVEDQA